VQALSPGMVGPLLGLPPTFELAGPGSPMRPDVQAGIVIVQVVNAIKDRHAVARSGTMAGELWNRSC